MRLHRDEAFMLIGAGLVMLAAFWWILSLPEMP
jgi:hypothetical protein